ncbi:MAG: tRNA (adenosine(37)-N6)-dimethylallyltransferase MiaA [Kiritimatiellae bacterium]|nr:tRNA (adenosine(37)-N6)-dimethylallyltransferase MiaA [Kiritimatiellia bacterium]
MHDLKAFFLVGPTAAGKTSVSQWIAERHPYDILSADAMMVYRGMDIGTAKPEKTLRAGVRYWGLDLVPPRSAFSVGRYREHALAAIRAATAPDRRMIVTGGTGLYIKSLTHGLTLLPAANAALREEAEALFQKSGLGALQEWAKTLAPEQYEALADKQNPRRLVRAVETAQNSVARQGGGWRLLGKGPKITGLAMPKEMLCERIKQRVDEMYAKGLLAETERLLKDNLSAGDAPASGLEFSPTAGKAIGYAEAIAFLRGQMPLEKARELTIARTCRLAKRQMTWFRNQANVEWVTINPGTTIARTAQMVLECWEKTGPAPISV